MWQINNSSLPLKAGFITVRKAALFKVKLSIHGGAASWLSGPSLSDGSVLRCLISRLLGDSFRRLSTWRNTEASLYLPRRPKTSYPENSTHSKSHTPTSITSANSDWSYGICYIPVNYLATATENTSGEYGEINQTYFLWENPRTWLLHSFQQKNIETCVRRQILCPLVISLSQSGMEQLT